MVLPSFVPLILVALLFFVVLSFGGIVLLSLSLRYRAGTARRHGRRWVVIMNVWLTGFSAVFFLFFSFFMSFWLGPSLRFVLVGMAIGLLLGLLGLALTRWEFQPQGLFYTPSRWLALLITVTITARFAYGWWRATHPHVSGALAGQNWFTGASATQLSLAFAAGLIGYYFMFAIGVRFNLLRHERSRSA